MTPHDALELRVAALEKEIPTIKAELTKNTGITSAIKDDTADLLEFIRACSGLVITARWLGRIVQWLAPVALVIVSAWAVIKGQKP